MEETKILAITCARSDAGLMAPVWREIQASPLLDLQICATGMHLLERFGHTVDAVREMGFDVAYEATSLLDSDVDGSGTAARAMGRGILTLTEIYEHARPDLLLVLGDRFDMFPAAAAALPLGIPVAHVSGGELSFGAIDECLRHAITKLSHLHFPCTEEGARRIIAMGEEPWRVRVVGAPGLDAIRGFEPWSVEKLGRRFGFSARGTNVLVTYHPVTLAPESTEIRLSEFLTALEQLDAQILFTWPNADPGSEIIVKGIEDFVTKHPERARVVVNAGHEGYLSLLCRSDLVVGNSSSGLTEAAAFETPVVDVGGRQEGRLHPSNVLWADDDAEQILAACREALSPAFRESLRGFRNPYGDGQAGRRIREVLEALPPRRQLRHKRFAPLEMEADDFKKSMDSKSHRSPAGVGILGPEAARFSTSPQSQQRQDLPTG
ncbi:MAG TPA: UDP-N-acetylglucosamine 2-epimerase (hydrolyzing) [Planctomycetes bacterium]|nr:UDP-N-acetylglucosamine 2-epimerase (hydrolyzing) [Planctomycetota bacterium]